MKWSRVKFIAENLGKCTMQLSGSAILIIDENGERVGDVIPYTNTITLYSNYTHAAEIEKRLIEDGFEIFDRELNRNIFQLSEESLMDD